MDQRESHAVSAEPGHPPSRGFWSLIVTQFGGAFNDNANQTLVVFFGQAMALSAVMRSALVPLTLGLFALPFIDKGVNP
jgi:hypothetical protein